MSKGTTLPVQSTSVMNVAELFDSSTQLTSHKQLHMLKRHREIQAQKKPEIEAKRQVDNYETVYLLRSFDHLLFIRSFVN